MLATTATVPATATVRGTILGTLPYMAPQQVQGQEADARTDLWALGTILYEMVTGTRAFEALSAVSLMGAILEREPASLAARQPLTPPGLERIVRRCLAKHPDDRWDSAHDVADELRWIAESPAKAAPTAAPASGPVVASGLTTKLLDALAHAIGAALRPALAALTKRIEALEARPEVK